MTGGDTVRDEVARRLWRGQRIREALLDRGWSGAELGRRCAISRDVISRAIRGRSKTRPENLHRIGQVLGLTLDPPPVLPPDAPALSEAGERRILAIETSSRAGMLILRVDQTLRGETALAVFNLLVAEEGRPVEGSSGAP